MLKFIRCFIYNMKRNEITLRAAALTYYAIFSISPLLFLFTILLGLILRNPARQQAMMDAALSLLPSGADIITQLLHSVMAARTLSGIVAFITLVWSATGFLRGLLSAIDLIHSRASTHTSFVMSGIGAIIILLSIPALILMTLLSGLSAYILQWLPASTPDFLVSIVRIIASNASTFIVAALAFYLMMRFIPRQRPPRLTTLISAAITSLAWVALGYGFSWYLNSGRANYNVIYGSLGAVIALLFYTYLTNAIILLGAQLNATLAQISHCEAPPILGLDKIIRRIRS